MCSVSAVPRSPGGGLVAASAASRRTQAPRRMADRQGLYLRKSRRRDPRALDFGSYWLIDLRTSTLVEGGPWGMGIDEVEEWLTTDPEEERA